MDYFLTFFSFIASTFFIANILYIVLQRKKTLPYLFLGLYHVFAIFELINFIASGAGGLAVLVYVLIRIVPVTLGSVLFIYYTGGSLGIPIKKFRSKKLKNTIKYDVIPLRFERLMLLVGMISSLLIASLSFIFINTLVTKYIIIIVSLIGLIAAFVFYLKNKHIQIEKVIIFVGRDKEQIYSYQIPSNLLNIPLKSFYERTDYIIDPIGIAYYQDEKHYLYWIGTSRELDLSNEVLTKIPNVPYASHLDVFKKFSYRTVWFEAKDEIVSIKMNKRIK
ncbi:MAG: hypothetical protein WC964_04410 [Acholeplasmataceae bacterium]